MATGRRGTTMRCPSFARAARLPHTRPRFVAQSQELIAVLREFTPARVASLMSLSDTLAGLNVARYQAWSPRFTAGNSRQAILAFNGDVYEGLAARSLSAEDWSRQTDCPEWDVRAMVVDGWVNLWPESFASRWTTTRSPSSASGRSSPGPEQPAFVGGLRVAEPVAAVSTTTFAYRAYDAEAIGRFETITEADDFDVEYWPTVDPTAFQGSREQMLDAYRDVRDGLMKARVSIDLATADLKAMLLPDRGTGRGGGACGRGSAAGEREPCDRRGPAVRTHPLDPRMQRVAENAFESPAQKPDAEQHEGDAARDVPERHGSRYGLPHLAAATATEGQRNFTRYASCP